MRKTTWFVLGALGLIFAAVGDVSAAGDCGDAAAHAGRAEGSAVTAENVDFELSANYTGAGCAKTSLSFTDADGTDIDTNVLCVVTEGNEARVVAAVTKPADLADMVVLMRVVDNGPASASGTPDEVGILMVETADLALDCSSDAVKTLPTAQVLKGNVTVHGK